MTYLLWCILLSLQSLFISCLSLHHGNILDIKVLNVGEELKRETLPLKMGKRMYHVRGLKESVWYEIKISYPASIPATFSLELKRNAPRLWLSKNRRLLNTEKTIFKSDSHNLNSDQNEMYVLVTAEAAGVVAKPHVQETEVVLFNMVCDEILFGIPHKAWWVGTAAILCIILASVAPKFLPSHMLLKNQTPPSSFPAMTKAS